MSCAYDTWGGQIYSGVQWLPFLVPTAISMAAWTFARSGRNGQLKPVKQLILLLFGLWLLVMEYFLYVLQYFYNIQRHDPYCTTLLTYAFPSRISFYLATLVTYLFFFALLWGARIHWVYWTCSFVLFLYPQALLVWMLYNTWQEVLVSSVIGVVSTAFFMIMYRLFVTDAVPYLIHQRPWTWFSAVDTWVLDEEQRIERVIVEGTLKSLQQYKELQ